MKSYSFCVLFMEVFYLLRVLDKQRFVETF